MIHTYTVTGMSCSGCKASVEGKLKTLKQVTEASVDFNKKEVSIEMSKSISIETLQDALPEKYKIIEKIDTRSLIDNKEKKSDLKQLYPLFLIFTYIIMASFLLNYTLWDFSGFMLDFMGLFYIVFSFFKFLDLKGFPESFKMYDPLANIFPIYGWLYPFIELFLGVLFLMRIQILTALIITLIILGVTTVGVVKALLDKKTIRCACLGTVLKLPMTKATFIENSVMIIMAVIMLLKHYN